MTSRILTATLVTAALSQMPLSAAHACTPIEVHNVRPAQGVVMLAVYDEAAEFRRKPVAAMQQRAGSGETLRFMLCGLAGATVAMSLYQDLNDNRKLDSNLMGLPTEPWGASGTPPAFAAPTWDSSKVVLGTTPIVIPLSK